MTPFAVLARLAGLSLREAGAFHGVRPDTVKSWSSGRNRCPPGAIAELRALVERQERSAAAAIAAIDRGRLDSVDLGCPADDLEARALGWPCVGAWGAMAARVIAGSAAPVAFVPRGSTPATRAAVAARG